MQNSTAFWRRGQGIHPYHLPRTPVIQPIHLFRYETFNGQLLPFHCPTPRTKACALLEHAIVLSSPSIHLLALHYTHYLHRNKKTLSTPSFPPLSSYPPSPPLSSSYSPTQPTIYHPTRLLSTTVVNVGIPTFHAISRVHGEKGRKKVVNIKDNQTSTIL